jgi:hypothetical protein
MAARLPKRYLLQTLLEKHKWACEILGPAPAQAEDVSPDNLQQITTSFWKGPRRMIAKLVELTRTWFFTLLRYTYRMRFFKGSKTYQTDLDVPDIQSCETQQYISELTESEVYRLICIPNKYGATFYRSSYKSAKQCLAWKRFCARIQTFCDLVGLFASPDDPEQSLNELQNNLSTVVLQRECLRTTARLDETARGTARYVRELDKRVASAGLSNLELTKEIRQQLRDLQLQCNRLRSAYTTPSDSQQWNLKLLTELESQRATWQRELHCLRSMIESSEAKSTRTIAAPAEQVEESRTRSINSNSPKNKHPSVEAVVACRWLLEHLPSTTPIQHGFGNQWRLFWQNQWTQYKKKASRDDHPLRGLAGDEKYNKVGKGLYSTLSNLLHEYGRLRMQPLDPDVQKVVDTISPVYYNSDGWIDLEAERGRWLT